MPETRLPNCAYAKKIKIPGIKTGQICLIDRALCQNYNKPELVKKCPTLKDLAAGKIPFGDKTPAPGYPGIPHVIRKGPFGYFVTGYPPEYLRGKIRKKTQF